jgi:hypothetical protein
VSILKKFENFNEQKTEFQAEDLLNFLKIVEKEARFKFKEELFKKIGEVDSATHNYSKEVKSLSIKLPITEEMKSNIFSERMIIGKDAEVNLGEYLNQMPNLVTLIDILDYLISENGGFQDSTVLVCHPSSTSSPSFKLDGDLVLLSHDKNYAIVEASDVLRPNNNDKLAKDLNSLFKKYNNYKDKKLNLYLSSRNSLFDGYLDSVCGGDEYIVYGVLKPENPKVYKSPKLRSRHNPKSKRSKETKFVNTKLKKLKLKNDLTKAFEISEWLIS